MSTAKLEYIWLDGNNTPRSKTKIIDLSDSSNLKSGQKIEIEQLPYWNYDGSLTTPPCEEGIKWTIINDVQPLSNSQLNKIKEIRDSLPFSPTLLITMRRQNHDRFHTQLLRNPIQIIICPSTNIYGKSSIHQYLAPSNY